MLQILCTEGCLGFLPGADLMDPEHDMEALMCTKNGDKWCATSLPEAFMNGTVDDDSMEVCAIVLTLRLLIEPHL